jgi:hypothetical protein
MGIHSLPARHWGRLTLVALLGLTLGLATVSAGQASSRGAGHAVAAKKCKKKKKHSASSAKKKKCKKVHHVVLPAPAPLVRATLSWTASDEVDLHAFDPSGNHAGWDFGVDGVVNNIPNARHNGDSGGPSGGTETFTDDIFVVGGPSNREFSYIACLYDNTPTGNSYTASFTGVSKGGTTTNLALDGPGIYTVSVPGGPALPNPLTVC